MASLSHDELMSQRQFNKQEQKYNKSLYDGICIESRDQTSVCYWAFLLHNIHNAALLMTQQTSCESLFLWRPVTCCYVWNIDDSDKLLSLFSINKAITAHNITDILYNNLMVLINAKKYRFSM